VTQSLIYLWTGGQTSEITSFIRYIIRAAIASSPSTSPIKDKVLREVSLAIFQDRRTGEQFDYGLGTMNLEDEEDEEEDEDEEYEEMDIVDLPDI
jgi:hypothetical protein